MLATQSRRVPQAIETLVAGVSIQGWQAVNDTPAPPFHKGRTTRAKALFSPHFDRVGCRLRGDAQGLLRTVRRVAFRDCPAVGVDLELTRVVHTPIARANEPLAKVRERRRRNRNPPTYV